MNPADIFEALNGPQARIHRERLQARLSEMETRLKTRMEQGTGASEFADLEAALLAVRAGLDTLSRLRIADQGQAQGPLVDSRRVIAGEHT